MLQIRTSKCFRSTAESQNKQTASDMQRFKFSISKVWNSNYSFDQVNFFISSILIVSPFGVQTNDPVAHLTNKHSNWRRWPKKIANKLKTNLKVRKWKSGKSCCLQNFSGSNLRCAGRLQSLWSNVYCPACICVKGPLRKRAKNRIYS